MVWEQILRASLTFDRGGRLVTYSSGMLSWIWYLHRGCAVWPWTSLPISPGPIFPIFKLESSWAGCSPRTFPTLKSCDSFLILEFTICAPGLFPKGLISLVGGVGALGHQACVILGVAVLSPESPLQLPCSVTACLPPRLVSQRRASASSHPAPRPFQRPASHLALQESRYASPFLSNIASLPRGRWRGEARAEEPGF